MAVMPGHVYVIPPNRDLSILHGVLHLQEPAQSAGLRLPIDSFFRSLAQDQQEHSIAVVLSGMGSDGTQGARAIRDRSGAVFVQTPASAKFDSMPRSTIDAGLADVVAPCAAAGKRGYRVLSAASFAYPRHWAEPGGHGGSPEQRSWWFCVRPPGTTFRSTRRTPVPPHQRRIDLHALHSLADYLRYLQENPQESELLFKELLIGVTSFFRDTEVWQQLTQEVIPALLAAYPNGGKLRAWSAGCSTGEEAYSLAIVFRGSPRAAKASGPLFPADICHRPGLRSHRHCSARHLSSAHRHRGLKGTPAALFCSGGARLPCGSRSEMVIFATQNVVMQPPFTKLNLLLCRNLLIHLEADLQRRLLFLCFTTV